MARLMKRVAPTLRIRFHRPPDVQTETDVILPRDYLYAGPANALDELVAWSRRLGANRRRCCAGAATPR